MIGIEIRGGLFVSLGDDTAGRLVREGFLVTATRPKGVVDVHESHDAGHDGNLLSAEPFGISRSIPFLVVIETDVPRHVQPSRFTEKFHSVECMTSDLGKLLLVETSRFGEDLVRNFHFTDVMQHAIHGEILQKLLVQAHALSQEEREGADALEMLSRLVVIGGGEPLKPQREVMIGAADLVHQKMSAKNAPHVGNEESDDILHLSQDGSPRSFFGEEKPSDIRAEIGNGKNVPVSSLSIEAVRPGTPGSVPPARPDKGLDIGTLQVTQQFLSASGSPS
jgi:hypothetical protein